MKHKNLTILLLYQTWNELLFLFFVFFFSSLIFRFATFDDATRFNFDRRKKNSIGFYNKVKVLFVMKKKHQMNETESKYVICPSIAGFAIVVHCIDGKKRKWFHSQCSKCVFGWKKSLFQHQLWSNFLLI